MKLKITTTLSLFFIVQVFFAQEVKNGSIKVDAKTTVNPVADSTQVAVTAAAISSKAKEDTKYLNDQLKSEKKALKEAKKIEKEQERFEKEKKDFNKKQSRILSGEKSVRNIKDKITKSQRNLITNKEKLDKKIAKDRLTSIEIEKENIKISKQQIKINKLEENFEKAEKKLSKLRD